MKTQENNRNIVIQESSINDDTEISGHGDIMSVAKDNSVDEANMVKHPQMIDLGLPSGTKWASCNVGATQPWEYGGYYAWGETEEKEVYTDMTYKYCTGEDTDGDGWYDKQQLYDDIGIIVSVQDNKESKGLTIRYPFELFSICGTVYDLAHMTWGDSWQMPSREQFDELIECCQHEWISLNGVEGCRFTGPNGNSIFLPAARNHSVFSEFTQATYCFYRTGSRFNDYDHDDHACFFYASPNETYCGRNGERYGGCSVRPVAK